MYQIHRPTSQVPNAGILISRRCDRAQPLDTFRLGLYILAKNGIFNFCDLPANPIKPLPRCCHRLLAIVAELQLGFFHQSLDRLQL
jgi:hypothetical protein